jgi:hypothetical protein
MKFKTTTKTIRITSGCNGRLLLKPDHVEAFSGHLRECLLDMKMMQKGCERRGCLSFLGKAAYTTQPPTVFSGSAKDLELFKRMKKVSNGVNYKIKIKKHGETHSLHFLHSKIDIRNYTVVQSSTFCRVYFA